eukprot:TRINITY_DN50101_c0_g1_i1.p1 TRINITY_DN50101_c0_g1~~TRINITY_DN50101_c0_g1_i1.p1  ORF type:complete len:421 (+),score=45.99 TRINITY_DN50101_c0_g1_i1:81-1343(+)
MLPAPPGLPRPPPRAGPVRPPPQQVDSPSARAPHHWLSREPLDPQDPESVRRGSPRSPSAQPPFRSRPGTPGGDGYERSVTPGAHPPGALAPAPPPRAATPAPRVLPVAPPADTTGGAAEDSAGNDAGDPAAASAHGVRFRQAATPPPPFCAGCLTEYTAEYLPHPLGHAGKRPNTTVSKPPCIPAGSGHYRTTHRTRYPPHYPCRPRPRRQKATPAWPFYGLTTNRELMPWRGGKPARICQPRPGRPLMCPASDSSIYRGDFRDPGVVERELRGDAEPDAWDPRFFRLRDRRPPLDFKYGPHTTTQYRHEYVPQEVVSPKGRYLPDKFDAPPSLPGHFDVPSPVRATDQQRAVEGAYDALMRSRGRVNHVKDCISTGQHGRPKKCHECFSWLDVQRRRAGYSPKAGDPLRKWRHLVPRS